RWQRAVEAGPEGGLLRRANDLRRRRPEHERGAGRDLRPRREHHPRERLRKRDRRRELRWLRSLDLDLHARPEYGLPLRRGVGGRNAACEYPDRRWGGPGPLRWREGFGLRRPRVRDGGVRLLQRAAGRLCRVLATLSSRSRA